METGYVYNPETFPSVEEIRKIAKKVSKFEYNIVRIYDVHSDGELIFEGNLWEYFSNEFYYLEYEHVVDHAKCDDIDVKEIMEKYARFSTEVSLTTEDYVIIYILEYEFCDCNDNVTYYIEGPETLMILSGVEAYPKLLLLPFSPRKVESMFGIEDGVMTTLDESIDKYVKRYNNKNQASINHVLNVRFQQ